MAIGNRYLAMTAATCLLLGSAHADEGLNADALAQAAKVWYEADFAVGFVEGDPDFFDHYMEPVYLGFGGAPGYHDKASLAAEIDAYIKPWVDAGWTKTALRSVEASAIDGKTALILARWSIDTADGAPATDCASPGWRYVVVKTDAGWRVLSEFEAPCTE